jgi:hypothetical protein
MGKYYILNRLVWFRPMLLQLFTLHTLNEALDAMKSLSGLLIPGVCAYGE